jgi:FtsP/CotA-like multicopper oxidase with cupredoxin domain
VFRTATLLLGGALLVSARRTPSAAPLPRAVTNDNRAAAGRLHGDSLELGLVVRMAEWRPEGEHGAAIAVAAFAEEGRAPSIPGPLVRVRQGTVIVATVRNDLPDSTIEVHGLLTRPAAADDSVVLRPGERRRVVFIAGAAGTYFYFANVGHRDFEKGDERETASGAFVVDPPGGSPPDRIWVLNIWGQALDSLHYRNALAINGRSWPGTEPITLTVGDTARWRVINATVRPHPMHLHGFFFRVDARGTALVDTLYPADRRMDEVTESMWPFSTYDMTWSPDRPGDWVYHCHIAYHVTDFATLEPPPPTGRDPRAMSSDPRVHMAGLVLGITVRPAGPAPAGPAPRHLDLYVDGGARRGLAPDPMGYVLQRGATPPAPDSLEPTSSMLVLTQGEPTAITVHNRLAEPTSVHWHGIELQSWSDGVVGWSGAPGRVAPAIAPGDSFTARLLLPRAGTFIYHTHLGDFRQLMAGLYGALVVLPPDTRFDSTTDHVFVVGRDGALASRDRAVVNGDTAAAPLHLRAGVAHRLRLINIDPADGAEVIFGQDSVPATWVPWAKDGADLPPALRAPAPARHLIRVGETYDYIVRPAPGRYTLFFDRGDRRHPFYRREIVVDE